MKKKTKNFINKWCFPIIMTAIFFGLAWYHTSFLDALIVPVVAFPYFYIGQVYMLEVFGEYGKWIK